MFRRQRLFPTLNLIEDVDGPCGPDERFWVLVVVGEVTVDRDLEVKHASEDAAPDALAGDLSEEALDEVQPRAGGRCKVQMKARVPL